MENFTQTSWLVLNKTYYNTHLMVFQKKQMQEYLLYSVQFKGLIDGWLYCGRLMALYALLLWELPVCRDEFRIQMEYLLFCENKLTQEAPENSLKYFLDWPGNRRGMHQQSGFLDNVCNSGWLTKCCRCLRLGSVSPEGRPFLHPLH